MNRKWFFLLIAIMLVATMAITLTACGGSTGDDGQMEDVDDDTSGQDTVTYLTYELLEDGTYGVIGWYTDGRLGALVIPDEHEGIAVTRILDNVFANINHLDSVVVGNNVKTIDVAAFNNCKNLKSISIPASVETMVGNCLSGCENLESITIAPENNYYKVEDGVLYNMAGTQLIRYIPTKSATSFTVPNTVLEIETNAFDKCVNLTSITLNEGLERIRDYAFAGCVNLEGEISLPESLISVGLFAFNSCSKITKVNILGSATNVTVAFLGCTNLQEYTVNAQNQHHSVIDGHLYNKEATALFSVAPKASTSTQFVIPDTVKEIVLCAFANCNFESIVIPKSVKNIGQMAFVDCDNLKNIYYTGTETEWGEISLTQYWNAKKFLLFTEEHDFTINYNYVIG